jgi:endonuclease YncB( thermonuclease family)
MIRRSKRKRADDDACNAPMFSLDGESVDAYIVDVHDGDTITAVFASRWTAPAGKRYKWHVRLAGVDTAEVRGNQRTAGQIAKAEEARQFVISKCLNRMVRIECLGNDKYGRLMGRVFVDSSSDDDNGGQQVELNALLISKKLAVAFGPNQWQKMQC